jgi:hypothetical protein
MEPGNDEELEDLCGEAYTPASLENAGLVEHLLLAFTTIVTPHLPCLIAEIKRLRG